MKEDNDIEFRGVRATINLGELVRELVAGLTYEELIEFINMIDDQAMDSQFTNQLEAAVKEW